MFGWKEAEVIGSCLADVIIPETQRDQHKQGLSRYLMSGESKVLNSAIEVHALLRDGSELPVDLTISVLKRKSSDFFVAVLRDISERKQSDKALKEANENLEKLVEERTREVKQSEERLKLAVDSGKVGIWDLNLQTNELIWDNNMFALYGAHREGFSGAYDAWSTRLHPEDRAATEAALRDAIDGLREYAPEFRVIWADGKIRYIKGHAQVINDQAGKPARMIGTNWDITERKQAEIKLKMLFQAIEHAGEAALITDRNAIIEYVNPAFTEITGYTAEEVIGKTPAVLKSSAQDTAFYKELWDTIQRGKVWHGTLIDRRKDGSFYPALMSVSPIHDDSGEITHYVSIQQDMSEYKRLEEQFLQSQKMEAIGILVGGIAHDFNNMLAGIVGNAYLAKSRIQGDQKLLGNIETIDKISMRAAEMIKQLLTFARKGQVKMHTFSLTHFLKEAVSLASTAVPESIARSCVAPSEELYVYGDSTQLQQVIMNLINNARDALEGIKGGKIDCVLKRYTADVSFSQRHPGCKGKRFACLTVRDNGHGIPEDVVEKIFDPFFTTKGVGKGTGLGLAMIYGAVEGHNGAIEVDSVPGKGTAFNIYLPLVSAEREDQPASGQRTEVGENELILVADDEELVREMYGTILPPLGYRVMVASNGEEAVRLFEQNMKEVTLAILDVVMPVLGGIDAAKKIKRLNGHLPIVFATGYDRGSLLVEEEGISDYTIINKPFSVESLSQLIRQALDARQAGGGGKPWCAMNERRKPLDAV